MNWKRFSGLLGAVLLCCLTQSAIAQTTANLTGTVTSDNAAIPGVTVTVSSPNLQGTRTAVTDANGNYNFAALPPGDYSVQFEMEGMQTVTHTVVARGNVELELLTQGSGHTIVLLPSLGRGASDFDPIAERLATHGFRVLRPQPRGIGLSRGPMTGIDLADLAGDDVLGVADGERGWAHRGVQFGAFSGSGLGVAHREAEVFGLRAEVAEVRVSGEGRGGYGGAGHGCAFSSGAERATLR